MLDMGCADQRLALQQAIEKVMLEVDSQKGEK